MWIQKAREIAMQVTILLAMTPLVVWLLVANSIRDALEWFSRRRSA